MGVEVDREAPFYFMKDAQSLVQTGATIAYPPGTDNYHYEMELVLAIGADIFRATAARAEGRYRSTFGPITRSRMAMKCHIALFRS